MKTIHHVLDVEAAAENTWDAVTTQRGLSHWWSTRVDVTDATQVGTTIDFTFAGDFNPTMEVTAAAAGTSVEWTCVGGHGPWADNTFRFEIEALGAQRSRLRFWQHYAIELDDDAYGTYNFNWGYYLQSLKDLVESGTGKPFDPATG